MEQLSRVQLHSLRARVFPRILLQQMLSLGAVPQLERSSWVGINLQQLQALTYQLQVQSVHQITYFSILTQTIPMELRLQFQELQLLSLPGFGKYKLKVKRLIQQIFIKWLNNYYNQYRIK